MNGSGVFPRKQPGAERRGPERGFTMMEMVIVAVIFMLMAAMAFPLVNNVTGYFRLRGAVSSITGAIQSARYQAIFQGCPYQLAFDSAANTYQLQRQCPAGGAFANYCVPVGGGASCPVPLSGTGTPITLNANVTLTFSPGGRVTSPQFPAGGITMVVSYGGKPPETISVSSYGSINVKP